MRRGTARRVMMSGIAVLAGVTLAGCGGSSSGGASAGGPQSSPKAAVMGYLGALAGGNVTTICNFIELPQGVTGSCPDLLGQALQGPGTLTGSPAVGNSITSGSQALVVLTGNFSVAGQTIENSDPNAGLPSNAAGFAQSYAAARSDPKIPDATLVEVDGKWFVEPS